MKKKLGEKKSGGKTGQRGGDKRHGYNCNAIAKLLNMKFWIVTLVIKVIKYVQKNNNNDNMLSKSGI